MHVRAFRLRHVGQYIETLVEQMSAKMQQAYEFTKKLRRIVPRPHRIWLAKPRRFWRMRLALLDALKPILNVVIVTFATGNWLPVILISLLFNLAQLGSKAVNQTITQDAILAPPSGGAVDDCPANSNSQM